MSDKEYFRPYAASYLLLEKDGKYLLGKRKGGWMEGYYGIPSGHLEDGETPTEAAIRETKEEIGVDIDPKDLEMRHVLYRNSTDRIYVDFFFTCKKWTGEPKIMEPNKCSELTWFQKDTLPKNIQPYLPAVFNHIQTNKIYSEYGWD